MIFIILLFYSKRRTTDFLKKKTFCYVFFCNIIRERKKKSTKKIKKNGPNWKQRSVRQQRIINVGVVKQTQLYHFSPTEVFAEGGMNFSGHRLVLPPKNSGRENRVCIIVLFDRDVEFRKNINKMIWTLKKNMVRESFVQMREQRRNLKMGGRMSGGMIYTEMLDREWQQKVALIVDGWKLWKWGKNAYTQALPWQLS